MDKPLFVFIDVQGKEFAPIGRMLSKRGFGIVANGGFASLIPGAKTWESFVPTNIANIVEQELTKFVADATTAIGSGKGRQAFDHVHGNFIRRTGVRFFGDLVHFRSNQVREIETLENIAANHHIAGIVLGCDNSHTQRTLVLHARTLGIPTIQLAHGIYGSMKHLSYAANMDQVYADYAAVFGDRAEEHMLRLGNDPARIAKVGSPVWHAMSVGSQEPNRAAAKWQLGLPAGGKVVLFTCSYGEAGSAFFKQMTSRFVEIHRALAKAMKVAGEDVHFLLRPHPTEMNRSSATDQESALIGDAYLSWMAGMSGTEPTLSTGDLILAIKASDLVIATCSSTVIGAAIQLDRPTINIPLIPGERPTYPECDGVVFADGDDLGPAIQRLLTEPGFRDSRLEVQRSSRPTLDIGHDGSSCLRLVDFLESVANQKSEAGDIPGKAKKSVAAVSFDKLTSKCLVGSVPKTNEMTRAERAEQLNDCGVAHFGTGDYQLALADFAQALQLDPLAPTILENILELLQNEQARLHFGAKQILETT